MVNELRLKILNDKCLKRWRTVTTEDTSSSARIQNKSERKKTGLKESQFMCFALFFFWHILYGGQKQKKPMIFQFSMLNNELVALTFAWTVFAWEHTKCKQRYLWNDKRLWKKNVIFITLNSINNITLSSNNNPLCGNLNEWKKWMSCEFKTYHVIQYDDLIHQTHKTLLFFPFFRWTIDE